MNSVPNSDSEQCTESRLGQVHNVHTPMAQAVHWAGRVLAHQTPRRGLPPGVSWPSPGHILGMSQPAPAVLHVMPHAVSREGLHRVVAPARPCRRECPTVSRRARTYCRAVSQLPCHDTNFISQHKPLPRAPCRALPRVSQPPASYRGTLLHRIVALARYIATQSRPPQPRYNFLYHDSPANKACHTPLCADGRVVAHAGRIVTHARSCRGRVLPVHARLLRALCHDTVYCIVTQNKKWAVAQPISSTSIFFFFFSLCSS